jgi:hypothetical protein
MLSVGLAACGTEQEQGGQAPTPTPGTSPKSLRPAAPGGRVSPLLSANFALLRTPADGVPPTVRRVLRIPGMRWNLARLIPVSLPGTYWLVPGSADLCVVAMAPRSPAVGAGCGSVGQALRHGIASISLNPSSGRRLTVGVAPKGTRTVLLQGGTSTTAVRVHHGIFELRDSASSPIEELTLR